MKISHRPELLAILPASLKWGLLSLVIAVLAGSASAVFLIALDWATTVRIEHPWLLWLLPVAGFLVGWVYLRFGQSVEAGNNLLIDQIHDPTRVIPLRMAPLVLGGTIISHLFGASVGREGTAVQMGGALADQLTHLLKLTHDDRRIILMTGISAGFSSVFGTPLAGAVFGLEVLSIGRLRYDALLPCTLAAIIADRVCLLWGVHHTHYAIPFVPPVTTWPIVAVVIAGALFGVTARVFADSTHRLSGWLKQRIPYGPFRPFASGRVIAIAALIPGSDRYLGLGIPTIIESFQQPLAPYDFAGKMAFTIVSLGAALKGGEVTPLFYIGATLGNALAPILNVPFPFLAGIGLVAVFAGAANTPLASTLMAIELFGSEVGVYALIGCVCSYLFSGHTGIYRSQRVGVSKHRPLPEGIKLSDIPTYHPERAGHEPDREDTGTQA